MAARRVSTLIVTELGYSRRKQGSISATYLLSYSDKLS